MERTDPKQTAVDGLYWSIRKVIEEGRKVVSIAAFPIGHALRDELGWTHYRILMREDDPMAREWFRNSIEEVLRKSS